MEAPTKQGERWSHLAIQEDRRVTSPAPDEVALVRQRVSELESQMERVAHMDAVEAVARRAHRIDAALAGVMERQDEAVRVLTERVDALANMARVHEWTERQEGLEGRHSFDGGAGAAGR